LKVIKAIIIIAPRGWPTVSCSQAFEQTLV